MKRFLPYNPKLKQRATEMRKNMTKPEQKIRFNYLKKLDFRVLRQKPIGNFIVDFYIPEKMTVIEIDGDVHLEKIVGYTTKKEFLY